MRNFKKTLFASFLCSIYVIFLGTSTFAGLLDADTYDSQNVEYDPKNFIYKIVHKESAEKPVAESDHCVVLNDQAHAFETHQMLCPKGNYANLPHFLSKASVEEKRDYVKQLMKLATSVKKGDPWHFVINIGPWGGQVVHHLHGHFLTGEQLRFDPLKFNRTDAERLKEHVSQAQAIHTNSQFRTFEVPASTVKRHIIIAPRNTQQASSFISLFKNDNDSGYQATTAFLDIFEEVLREPDYKKGARLAIHAGGDYEKDGVPFFHVHILGGQELTKGDAGNT